VAKTDEGLGSAEVTQLARSFHEMFGESNRVGLRDKDTTVGLRPQKLLSLALERIDLLDEICDLFGIEGALVQKESILGELGDLLSGRGSPRKRRRLPRKCLVERM
jgi:hypothetical protein